MIPLLRNGWRLYGPAPELDRVEEELARRERERRRTAGVAIASQCIGGDADAGSARSDGGLPPGSLRRDTPSDTASCPPQAYPLGWKAMATAPSEPLSQRLAAIRDQLNLLADYL